VERLRAGELLAVAPDLAAGAETVGDAQVVTREVAGGLGGTDLRRLAAEVRGRLPAARPGVVLLASEVEGIVQFVVAVNEAGRPPGCTPATSSRPSRRSSARVAGARPTWRRARAAAARSSTRPSPRPASRLLLTPRERSAEARYAVPVGRRMDHS
jgi:alanyl-tRNA synthetase